MPGRYYVFLYTRGAGWEDGTDAFEQPYLQDHFKHMGKLEQEGKLIIGGPFRDQSGVMGVLKAGSLEEARHLISEDPVVLNKVFEAEVKAWEPAVTGCIESESE